MKIMSILILLEESKFKKMPHYCENHVNLTLLRQISKSALVHVKQGNKRGKEKVKLMLK